MSNLSEAKKKFVFTTKVEFDEDFVELREPTQEEIVFLKKNFKEDDIDTVDKMENLFTSCLINHSFTDDNGSKSDNEEVYKALKGSSTLFNEILTTWLNSLPFQSRTRRAEK